MTETKDAGESAQFDVHDWEGKICVEWLLPEGRSTRRHDWLLVTESEATDLVEKLRAHIEHRKAQTAKEPRR